MRRMSLLGAVGVLATTLPLPAHVLADAVSFTAGAGIPLATASQSVEVGDLNGDGRLDLVASPNFGVARYFLNNGTASPFSGAGFPLDPARTANEVAIADVNGDGRRDIVVGSFNRRNHVYFNNGTANPFVGAVGVFLGYPPAARSRLLGRRSAGRRWWRSRVPLVWRPA